MIYPEKFEHRNTNLIEKIKRGEKYLAKSAKADAAQVINRYNRDPEKRAAVDNYIKSLKTNSATLAELRTQMMDIRIK